MYVILPTWPPTAHDGPIGTVTIDGGRRLSLEPYQRRNRAVREIPCASRGWRAWKVCLQAI